MMIWTAGIDLEVNEQQDMTSYVVHYQKKKKTCLGCKGKTTLKKHSDQLV